MPQSKPNGISLRFPLAKLTLFYHVKAQKRIVLNPIIYLYLGAMPQRICAPKNLESNSNSEEREGRFAIESLFGLRLQLLCEKQGSYRFEVQCGDTCH